MRYGRQARIGYKQSGRNAAQIIRTYIKLWLERIQIHMSNFVDYGGYIKILKEIMSRGNSATPAACVVEHAGSGSRSKIHLDESAAHAPLWDALSLGTT